MFFKHTHLADAPLMAAAVVAACRVNGWVNGLQPQFLSVIFKQLMQYDCDFHTLPAISIDEFARRMPEQEKRNEVIDLMLAVEMLCAVIPKETSDAVTLWHCSAARSCKQIHRISATGFLSNQLLSRQRPRRFNISRAGKSLRLNGDHAHDRGVA